MSMRRAIVAVGVAVGLAWLSTPPSDAATSTPLPARDDHLVCGSATPGYAACAAHVQTDQRTARAAATVGYDGSTGNGAPNGAVSPF